MSMEIETEGKILARSKDDDELLVYDYFKHLTTLSLVALGGVLSISTSIPGISPRSIIVIVVLLGLAGAVSLAALDVMVNERMYNRAIPRYIRYLRMVSVCFFGIGIGYFIAVVVEGRSANPPHVIAKQAPPAKSQEPKK
jgi:hypothetical protein